MNKFHAQLPENYIWLSMTYVVNESKNHFYIDMDHNDDAKIKLDDQLVDWLQEQ